MKKIEKSEMTISEHLQELRTRLFICTISFAIVAVFAFYAFDFFWPFILLPLKNSSAVNLVNLSPAEGISVSLLVASLTAILLTSPIFLYHLYAFCAPAVQNNRRIFLFAFFAACILFFAGGAFAYFFAIPLLFHFLANYSESITQLWSQTSYVSFLFRFEILFAILFQLPVAAAFFAQTGIADRRFLLRHFRLILFLIAFLSAFFTPPDLLSLFWMAIPLSLLYLLSLLTYHLAWRKR